MKIAKLPWLGHEEQRKRFEVYSLSVNSDGTRLASGGLDGQVRIWALNSVKKAIEGNNVEKSECQPVCSVSRHTGAVTAVSFSPVGGLLATGSDDRVVLIWEKEDIADLEHWTVRKRLVAHDNDVQDIAWAPDGSILVTVGLDRSVIVWSGTTFEKLKRFEVHDSHVKGVVFDPANKYFATASDDRTVAVFRYHKSTAGNGINFSIEARVSEPFRDSPLTTYFRRLSWSPDGQHMAVPNATNGPVSSVAIISRGDWRSNLSLIGHSSPCEVVSFSPRLYEVAANGDSKKKQVCSVVATAGQDKTLALWHTAKARPLVVAHDICWKTISDMAWAPDGMSLYVSSLDGTITAVVFEPGELGHVLDSADNTDYLFRYGADRESVVYPESVDQLVLEQQAASRGVLARKSVESGLLQPKKHEAAEKKRQPIRVNTVKPHTKFSAVRITKSGKKRVAPTLMTASRPATEPGFVAGPVSGVSSKQMDIVKRSILSSSLYKVPKNGVRTLVAGVRDRAFDTNGAVDGNIDANGDHLRAPTDRKPKKSSVKASKDTDYPEFLENLVKNSVQATALYNYTAYSTRNRSTLVVFGNTLTNSGTTLHIQNNYEYENNDDKSISIDGREPSGLPCRVVCTDSSGTQLFETFFAHSVVNCAAGADCWVLATSHSVHVISHSGRQIMPTLAVGSSVCALAVGSNVAMVVTCDGTVSAWDFALRQSVCSKVPLARLVQPSGSSKVSSVHVTSDAVPLVVMDNGSRFCWSSSLMSWVSPQE